VARPRLGYLPRAHFEVVVVHVDGVARREGLHGEGGRGVARQRQRPTRLSGRRRLQLAGRLAGGLWKDESVNPASGSPAPQRPSEATPTCLFTRSFTNLETFFLGPRGRPISFRSSMVHMS